MKKEMNEKKSILIVDDDVGICRTLSLIFEKKGYETEAAGTGQEAIEKAQERFFNMALLDIKLPDMGGVELLAPLNSIHPDMVMVIITAHASLETARRAMLEGAWAYITKPLNMDEVLLTVGGALEKQRLIMENRRLYEEAQQRLAEQKRTEEQLKESLEKLRKVLGETVNTLAVTAEMRDQYTAGHQQRVTQLACAIAKEMNLSEEVIEEIRVAGTLHDIGKMYVPSEILAKPGKLTETEFNMIKTHSKAGYDILKTIEFPWPVAQIVLQHHERIDGSGYPQGLLGDDILREARILGVADVVEAMASHRPYRPALGIDKALEEISQNRGDLYDTEVVDVCLGLFSKKKFEFKQDSQTKRQAISSSKRAGDERQALSSR